jgi:hypothetical protein
MSKKDKGNQRPDKPVKVSTKADRKAKKQKKAGK